MLETIKLIHRYYAAFNAGDAAGMLSLLTEDVQHDINEGDTQTGMELFRRFLAEMDTHYHEQAQDLSIMATPDGQLAVGAFFEVRQDKIARVTNYTGLGSTPHIRGKRPNVLRAAQSRIFFYAPCSEKQFGCPNYFSKPYYYNLADWTRQVGGPQ